MASKKQAPGNDNASAKPQAAQHAESAAQPIDPGTAIRRARLDPRSPSPQDVLQLQRMMGNRAVSRLLAQTTQHQPIQKKENNIGLPDNLKSGIENLSGFSMDDVKVQYNSSMPAELNALACAQGTDIHLAPGQEKHLPHEAWHVVQQKQRRVAPTRQMKGKVGMNDDEGLEKEATEMGAQAIQLGFAGTNGSNDEHDNLTVSAPSGTIVQRLPGYEGIKPLHIEEEWVNAYLDDLSDQTTHYEEMDAIDYIGGLDRLGNLGMKREGNHYNITLPDGQVIKTRSDGNCVIHAVYLINEINHHNLVIADIANPPDVPQKIISDFQIKLRAKLNMDRREVKLRIARQMNQSATVAETGFGPKLMALISPTVEQIERERLLTSKQMLSGVGSSGGDPDLDLLSNIRRINEFFAQRLMGMMQLYEFFNVLKQKMTTARPSDIMSAFTAQFDELDHLLKFSGNTESLGELDSKAEAVPSISFTAPTQEKKVTREVKISSGEVRTISRHEEIPITDQKELQVYLLEKIQIVQQLLEGESWHKYISQGFLNYSDFHTGGEKKQVLEGKELLLANRGKCLSILKKIAPLITEFEIGEQDPLYEAEEFQKGAHFNTEAYLLANQTVPGSASELAHTLSDTSNFNSCMANAVSFADKLGACSSKIDTTNLLDNLKIAKSMVSQGGYAIMAVRLAIHGIALIISKNKVFELEAAAAGNSEKLDKNSILADMIRKIEAGKIEGIPLDKYIEKLEAAITSNDEGLLAPEFMSDEPDAFFSLTWNLSLQGRHSVPFTTRMKEDVEVLAPPRLINLEHFATTQESLVNKLGTIL